jgi:hypothetical protein
VAFAFAVAACLIAALASALRGEKYVDPGTPADVEPDTANAEPER